MSKKIVIVSAYATGTDVSIAFRKKDRDAEIMFLA